jgi:hypothetical protein
MPYKLKPKELAFQVTREGKFEYHRYRQGQIYEEIPPEDVHRFEKTQSAESIAHSDESKKQKTESRK